MSEPFVSSFDQRFLDAFKAGCEAIPEDQTETIKGILGKIHERVIYDLEYYIAETIKANMNQAIRDEAASVASSMLANALAGDDKGIRNLFGFNDYYMKHLYAGDKRPTQWALIDAIVQRRPDLFVDERIAQRDQEIEVLKAGAARLEREIEFLRGKCGEGVR